MRRGQRLSPDPTEDMIDDLEKRGPTCCSPVPSPYPPSLPTHAGAVSRKKPYHQIHRAEAEQVYVWVQNGNGATEKGPFPLDCTVAQDQWQSFGSDATGLPYVLEVQSGHACAFDAADDGNFNGLHVRYAAEYQDVPTGVGNGQCSSHDNGVTCNAFLVE